MSASLEEISAKLSLEIVKQLGDAQTYSRGTALSKTFGDFKCVHASRQTQNFLFLETQYPPNTSTIALDVTTVEKPVIAACHCSCDPEIRNLKGCKHTVGLLLYFIRAPRSFVNRESPTPFELEASLIKKSESPQATDGSKPDDAKQASDQQTTKDSKKRVLPSWMTGGPLERKPPPKQIIPEDENEAAGPVYMMLEHELLAAAADYLRMAESFPVIEPPSGNAGVADNDKADEDEDEDEDEDDGDGDE